MRLAGDEVNACLQTKLANQQPGLSDQLAPLQLKGVGGGSMRRP
jgi:hypothetical protein